MPWTVADVDRFKSGLTQSQKRQWVRIANSVLRDCLDGGGSQSSCEASAIRQANGTVGNNNMKLNKLVNNNANYEVREQTFDGRTHIIVPVTMMVEGVHAGSRGAIFHSADELGRYPAVWNGIPIVVYHPQRNGQPISANIPEVLENEKVGTIFNTRLQGEKLKAEAWIDRERLYSVSPDTLNRILNTEPLNVSTGVFADEDGEPGEWNGEQYNSTAYNHRPDHLALLPDEEGACNLEDGCGIRNNQKNTNNMENKRSEEKEKLFQANLKQMQLNQKGYQEIGEQLQRKLDTMDTGDRIHYLVELYEDTFIYKVDTRNGVEYYKREYEVNEENDSVEITGDPVKVRRNIEYMKVTNQNNNSNMTQKKGNQEQGNTQNQNNNTGNCCEEKVQGLIDNSQTQFTDDDKSWLNNLTNEQLEKLEPAQTSQNNETGDSEQSTQNNSEGSGQQAEQLTQEQVAQALQNYSNPEDFLSLLPKEIADQMRNGLKLHQNHRSNLISTITNNSNEFNEDELKNMDTEMLQKISKSVQPVTDYSGMGAGGQVNSGERNKVEPLTPPGVTDKSKGNN